MKMRLKYINSPPIQWVLVGVHMIAMFTFFGVTLNLFGKYFYMLIRSAREAGLPIESIFFQQMAAEMDSLVSILSVVLAIACILGCSFYIWYSHKVIGPLVSLMAYLDKFQEARKKGELIEPLKFRKGDLLHELAEKINTLLGVSEKLNNHEE